jgi:amino acid permease
MGAVVNTAKNIFEVPKFNAAFMAINLLLGAGPIIVPEPYFEAGILLSTLWTAIILAISFNSALYIGESMEKIRRHQKKLNLSETVITSPDHVDSILSQEDDPLLEKEFESYDHIEQFRILFGEKWKFFPALAISIYLLGVSISKCIMTGKTLSKLFSHVDILNTFEFWLGLFFISGAAFSFKSISKTKPIQVVTITVRFVSVFLMILGAIIIIFQNDFNMTFTPTNGNAFFNFDFFGDIFSNLVFSFLFHHSIPTISQTLRKTEEIN